MIKVRQVICPVSSEVVNENLTRLNAFFAILLIVAGFVFNTVLFPLILLADFFIRAFTRVKVSPVSYLSATVLKVLPLRRKNVDKAPKIFAARLGFLMTLLIVTFFLWPLYTVSLVIAGILLFFATLEFAFGICVGCIIYTYFVLPFFE